MRPLLLHNAAKSNWCYSSQWNQPTLNQQFLFGRKCCIPQKHLSSLCLSFGKTFFYYLLNGDFLILNRNPPSTEASRYPLLPPWYKFKKNKTVHDTASNADDTNKNSMTALTACVMWWLCSVLVLHPFGFQIYCQQIRCLVCLALCLVNSFQPSVCQILCLESSAATHFFQWQVHPCHNLLLSRLLMLSQIIRASLNAIIHCARLNIFSQNCYTMVNGLTFVFAIASVRAWSIKL